MHDIIRNFLVELTIVFIYSYKVNLIRLTNAAKLTEIDVSFISIGL